MKKLTLFGMILTCLLGLGLWQQQRFVAKAAPLFNTLTVINTNDSGAGSLRQAIASAASGDTIVFDATVFATPQTINLTSGELTLDKSLTIDGPGANQLTINTNGTSRVFMIPSLVALESNIVALEGLTIAGGNSAAGGGIYQGTATLTITNVSVIGNNATISGGGIYKPGGTLTVINSTIASNTGSSNAGVYNQFGTMTLTNSTVSDNFANTNGGGLANGGILTVTNSTISNNAALTSGGGIFSSGTETLNNTIVAGNLTGAGPSDIVGTIEVANNNLIGNAGSSGGIANGVNGNKVGNAGVGTLNINTIIEITLENNGGPTQTHRLMPLSPAIDAGSNALAAGLTTDQRGVGFVRVADGNGDSTPVVDIGAYELSCPALVTNTNDSGPGSLRQTIADACPNATITFDTAGTFATPQIITLTTGELVINKSLTIDGPGASQLTVSGNNASRVFFIDTGNTVTLDGLTVTGGNGTGAVDSGNGGGIANFGTLTLTNSTVSGNEGGFGGGIFNNGTLTIINGTVSGNDGGGGAGIFNQGSSSTLTVTNSTVSGNTTPNKGGGILNLGRARLTNSTVSGNSADQGGGIWHIPLGGPLNVTNCTITGNRADADGNGDGAGGGILVSVETLNNSIVAGNFIGTGTTPDDINATVQVANNNLIGDAATSGGIINGVNGNKVGNSGVGTLDINTVLDTTLANNGGPTKTHRLKPGSPAIDAGSNAFALDAASNPLTTDQRGAGFPRIVDGNGDSTALVDIGAVEEVQPVSITVTTSPAGLSFTVDGTTYTSSQTFNWVPGSSHTIATTSPQSLAAGTQVVFLSWSDSGAISHTVSPTSATTYTANFKTQYQLTTSAGTGGTISPASGFYDAGSNLTITATATAGYSFTGFSGALTGTANPQSLTLTAPATVNATFAGSTVFNFVGFFQPVDNLPTVNSVNAGQSIPVKFSLTGYQGMNIFAASFPASQNIPCSGGTPDPIEETATAGASGLSYDAATDRYTYVWKTEKAWKNTCRKLVVKFTDGTTREALFQFR